MKGRYGWLLLVLFVAGWDLVAAMTNGESLSFTFRRSVAETAWKWPVLVVIVLLTVHLFLPPRLRHHDPLDRLYQRIATAFQSPRRHTPTPDLPTTVHRPPMTVRPRR
jgi:hypothetical protein